MRVFSNEVRREFRDERYIDCKTIPLRFQVQRILPGDHPREGAAGFKNSLS
jgi:hypothetical protein